MFREITPLHYQGNIADPPMLTSTPYEITDNYGTSDDEEDGICYPDFMSDNSPADEEFANA